MSQAQHGLLTEDKYDLDPLLEPSFSSAQPHLISPVDLGDLVRAKILSGRLAFRLKKAQRDLRSVMVRKIFCHFLLRKAI
jgi:hypothetical protein